jgi:hypothetical protein
MVAELAIVCLLVVSALAKGLPKGGITGTGHTVGFGELKVRRLQDLLWLA